MKIGGLLIASSIASALALVPAPARSAQEGVSSPTLVASFDPALGELPESIAQDARGNLYVSMAASVVKVTPERVVSTLVTLPIAEGAFAAGVKLGPDGFLYVASAALDPALQASFVWRVSRETGVAEQVAALDPSGFPNDLAFDDQGNVFVTDPFLALIWKIDATGAATVWLSDTAFEGTPDQPALGTAFGVDGIAFDRGKRCLYLSNLDRGAILRVGVGRDASPGSVQVVAQDPRLRGADGIALDAAGLLYVAVNAQDRIATVDRQGRLGVLVEGGLLDGPSSLAFGVPGRDRHTLFITNFAISRATGLVPGAPRPGILSLQVTRPGLPIP
jgi:sugar lactone lactonase YvrE